jgi:hypothetical protein
VKCRVPPDIQAMDLFASVGFLLAGKIQGTGRLAP